MTTGTRPSRLTRLERPPERPFEAPVYSTTC
jgi:hypothetical protein